MTLLDHAIWWHVYPLGAVGAPVHDRPRTEDGRGYADADHRLRRLDPWLDYAVELGCSGLLLGPIFDSTSHGYDTLDHYRIDPRLGEEEDLEHLLEGCRRRGLAVVLDGVFNHVGAEHPLVPAALAGGGVVALRDGAARPWEGHGGLAELDHGDPRTADLVVDVMLHWLRRGIAGWRLDVAYAVPPAFWAQVLGRVREEFPDAVFLGEVIHGDYPGLAAAGTLDSVTQYELWKGIWSSLKDRNLWELAWALQRHEEFSRSLVTNTFVGNHDVPRIASTLGDDGAALAAALLLTLPGMPSIYYGDEQAFRGVKGAGFSSDAPLRPALPPTPADLAPQGWWLYRLHQELIGLRRRHPWLVRGSVEVLDKANGWIRYAVRGEGHVLEAYLVVDPAASVRVRVDGVEAFTWAAGQPV